MKKWAEEADLKKWAALAIVAALAVTLTLGSVIFLVGATISISRMTNPAMRALATVAELLAGTLWLVGTIYVVTHLAVLIFGKDIAPRPYPTTSVDVRRSEIGPPERKHALRLPRLSCRSFEPG